MSRSIIATKARYLKEINHVIDQAQRKKDQVSVDAADGVVIYALAPDRNGEVAWGVVERGENILQGRRRPDGEDYGMC
jgi:hypothetical protein